MAVSTQRVAGGELRSSNPATLELVGVVPLTPTDAVQDAVAEARLAQERWARSPAAERRLLLDRAAAAVVADMAEIAAVVTAETGKPLVEAYAHDVLIAIEHARWLARNAARVLRPERLPRPALYLPQKRQRIEHEPVGVVAVVAPWNVPFSVPFTQAATAVAAGNAVVLKPSEHAPLSAALVTRAFARAGAPHGLVQVVQGGPDVGRALVTARGLGKIVFTGSADAGRAVAAAAAELLVPVTLELGSKDPMIVLADADLDRAVEGALWAAFANCGQLCMSVERIYVERPLHEPFLERLAARARGLRIGRGDAPGTDLGPLISEEQRDKVERLVERAAAAGADVRAGGRRPDVGLPGWFYEPTVLTGTRPSDELSRAEIFGPVVTVDAVADGDAAVVAANATPFGLGASVWTRSADRFRSLAARIDAGSVWMNDAMYSYGSGAAAWTGRKESGYGVSHGKYALYDVTRPKLVDSDSGRLRAPWWFPYADDAPEGFRGLVEGLYGDGLVPRARALWRERRSLARLARRYLR